jgi:fluoride exporter
VRVLFVAIGGGIGTYVRYVLSNISFENIHIFPIQTFFINIIGAFLLSLMFSLFRSTSFIDSKYFKGISVGFLGSFTTFSSFSYEFLYLIEQDFILIAFLYLFGSLIFGIVFGLFGIKLGEKIYQQLSLKEGN